MGLVFSVDAPFFREQARWLTHSFSLVNEASLWSVLDKVWTASTCASVLSLSLSYDIDSGRQSSATMLHKSRLYSWAHMPICVTKLPQLRRPNSVAKLSSVSTNAISHLNPPVHQPQQTLMYIHLHSQRFVFALPNATRVYSRR